MKAKCKILYANGESMLTEPYEMNMVLREWRADGMRDLVIQTDYLTDEIEAVEENITISLLDLAFSQNRCGGEKPIYKRHKEYKIIEADSRGDAIMLAVDYYRATLHKMAIFRKAFDKAQAAADPDEIEAERMAQNLGRG